MTDIFRSAGEFGETFKFDEVGVTWQGTISDCREIDDPNKPGQKVMIIEGESAASGAKETIWLSKVGLLKAIGAAMNEAGYVAGMPQPGAKLEITRTEDGVASKPGYSAPHRFKARYAQPTTAFQAAATEPEAAAPAPEPAPAPAAAPSGFFS